MTTKELKIEEIREQIELGVIWGILRLIGWIVLISIALFILIMPFYFTYQAGKSGGYLSLIEKINRAGEVDLYMGSEYIMTLEEKDYYVPYAFNSSIYSGYLSLSKTKGDEK